MCVLCVNFLFLSFLLFPCDTITASSGSNDHTILPRVYSALKVRIGMCEGHAVRQPRNSFATSNPLTQNTTVSRTFQDFRQLGRFPKQTPSVPSSPPASTNGPPTTTSPAVTDLSDLHAAREVLDRWVGGR